MIALLHILGILLIFCNNFSFSLELDVSKGTAIGATNAIKHCGGLMSPTLVKAHENAMTHPTFRNVLESLMLYSSMVVFKATSISTVF